MGYDVIDLVTTAGGSVAFASFIYHVSGITTNGPISMYPPCPDGLVQRDGHWHLTHEHDPVPFNPETG